MQSKVLGLGLPWPESFEELYDHYGGCAAVVARIIGLTRPTIASYAKDGQRPISKHSRRAFFRYGYTENELPLVIGSLTRDQLAQRYEGAAPNPAVVEVKKQPLYPINEEALGDDEVDWGNPAVIFWQRMMEAHRPQSFGGQVQADPVKRDHLAYIRDSFSGLWAKSGSGHDRKCRRVQRGQNMICAPECPIRQSLTDKRRQANVDEALHWEIYYRYIQRGRPFSVSNGKATRIMERTDHMKLRRILAKEHP